MGKGAVASIETDVVVGTTGATGGACGRPAFAVDVGTACPGSTQTVVVMTTVSMTSATIVETKTSRLALSGAAAARARSEDRVKNAEVFMVL